MARKGWTKVEVPDSWLQMIVDLAHHRSSGQKPSARWRRHILQWRTCDHIPSSPVFQKSDHDDHQRRSPRRRSIESKSWKLHEALGDKDTPEVKAIQEALKKARVTAQGLRWECSSRSAKSLSQDVRHALPHWTKSVSKEVERMEEGRANLERLRQALAAQQVIPPECPSKMEQLRRQVASLQRQLGEAEYPGGSHTRVRFVDVPVDAGPPGGFAGSDSRWKWRRSGEDLSGDRQESTTTRHSTLGHSGSPKFVVRIVSHRCGMSGIRVGDVVNPGRGKRGLRLPVATRIATWGFRGVQVGEASHPDRPDGTC